MNGTCFAATWMLSPWARLRSDLCRLRIDVFVSNAGRASARGESASSLSSRVGAAAASTRRPRRSPCFIALVVMRAPLAQFLALQGDERGRSQATRVRHPGVAARPSCGSSCYGGICNAPVRWYGGPRLMRPAGRPFAHKLPPFSARARRCLSLLVSYLYRPLAATSRMPLVRVPTS